MKSFVCQVCGKRHQGVPTAWGFQEPDEVFALAYIPKYLRVRSNADLCTLDESRFFLRGNLLLPLREGEGDFSWGIWVEVSEDHHAVYAAQILKQSFEQMRLEGRIANSIPGYRSTLGIRVDVLLDESGDRPTLWLPARSRHALAREQAKGISSKRQHELLEACGFFEKQKEANP
jgi:hypothetical protein